MKGDFSRDTFKPARHYSSVRLQQGRVVTDADWNEQADITRHRDERLAADVIGPCGVPEIAPGFEVSAGTYPLAAFALPGFDDAWVVGEDGAILLTLDGGATWTSQEAGTLARLHAVHFATALLGWAVGDEGTILETNDGGFTWTAQASPVTVGLRAVFALDASRAWAVGDAGTVLRTVDGGTTWTASTAGSGRLYAVRFADAARGWVAGQDGWIATTTDGGLTWVAQTSGTSAHLRALQFADASVGWAGGDGGTILKTTNGGTSWAPQATGVSERLRSIAFFGANDGWAVGDGGVALRTTNGGSTWVRQDLGTEATLRAVSLSAAQQGFVVGDGSLAFRIAGGSASPLAPLPGTSLSLGPGRMYVDGVLCELEERTSFYAQPSLPAPSRLAPGTHLIFIEAWQRHVSPLEDPAIREVALGGPDTATRGQTVWQVKTLGAGSASPPPHCLSDLPEWRELIEPSSARLRARAEPQQIATGVCEIAAAAGYRRLENQLYRVEVHAASPASFKWSRENGSVAYAITAVTDDSVKMETVVRLASRGPDDNLDLAPDDWVEIVDDDATLGAGAGALHQYLRDGDDELEIVLQGIVGGTVGRDPSRHPVLRRWEQKPTGGASALPIEEGQWLDLEEGVQVWFEPSERYRAGDHWLIPARTITRDVEWERDEVGHPEARPPAGIERRFCRLALVEAGANGTLEVVSDCRNLFPPLTALTQLFYVSGDGQDGIPGQELPQRLRVRVSRGEHPVAGRRVRFTIEAGTGTLVGSPPTAPLEGTTASDGTAECRWILEANPHPSRSAQRVRAALLDAAGDEIEGQLVGFCATATVGLRFAGGDGQEATAGQLLDHPLEVQVANGQRPVAGARVRYQVVTGGGQIVGANPATTNAAGAASVQWRLGASGPQRVQAELLAAGNVPIQSTAFGAAIRPPATAGAGCDVTVGERGGQIPRLNTQELQRLFTEFRGRVCLCFLPGEHSVDDLQADFPEGRLSIHGCGRATTVRLAGRAGFRRLDHVQLAHLEVLTEQDGGFTFEGCDEVDLDSLIVRAPGSPAAPLVELRGVRAVSIGHSQLVTKLPGAALVFHDPPLEARLVHDEIEGHLSFYGPPGPPVPEPVIERLFGTIGPGQVTFRGRGRLAVRDCSLQAVSISEAMIGRLAQLTPGSVLDGVFEVATIDGCTIAAPEATLVARRTALTSCSFLIELEGRRYGVFVSESATGVGNLAGRRAADAPLVMVTERTFFQLEAANVVFIRHL